MTRPGFNRHGGLQGGPPLRRHLMTDDSPSDPASGFNSPGSTASTALCDSLEKARLPPV